MDDSVGVGDWTQMVVTLYFDLFFWGNKPQSQKQYDF